MFPSLLRALTYKVLHAETDVCFIADTCLLFVVNMENSHIRPEETNIPLVEYLKDSVSMPWKVQLSALE